VTAYARKMKAIFAMKIAAATAYVSQEKIQQSAEKIAADIAEMENAWDSNAKKTTNQVFITVLNKPEETAEISAVMVFVIKEKILRIVQQIAYGRSAETEYAHQMTAVLNNVRKIVQLSAVIANATKVKAT
jgi:hypothetical protein